MSMCLPQQQTSKNMLIHLICEDEKKTLRDPETLGVHNGGCHLPMCGVVEGIFKIQEN